MQKERPENKRRKQKAEDWTKRLKVSVIETVMKGKGAAKFSSKACRHQWESQEDVSWILSHRSDVSKLWNDPAAGNISSEILVFIQSRAQENLLSSDRGPGIAGN